MSANLALSFKIDAETAAALKKVSAFQRELAALNGVKLQDPTVGITAGFAGASKGLAGLAGGFIALGAAAAGAAGAVASVGIALKKGFEFNSEMESAKLGITGLIAAMAEVRNANGKIAEGPEALAIAAGIAEEQMQKLRIAGLQTTATTKELAEAFQAALSAGLGVGFNPDQVRELTVGLVQAAGAMGIAADQMKSEINALFSGDINPDADLSKKLGISREQVAAWKAAGPLEFYDELNKRLTIYKLLGDESAKTWKGTLSAAADAADMFFGKMSEGAFNKVKTAIQDALKGAFDAKTLGVDASLEGVVAAGTTAFGALGTVMADAISGAVGLAKDLSGWFDTHQDQVLTISNTFGVLYDNVKGVLGSIISAVGAVAGLSVESGNVQGAFGAIAIIVALIQDGLQLWKGVIADVGGYILDKVGGPLKSVLGSLRDFLAQIPGIGTGLAAAVDSLVRAIPSSGAGLHKVAAGIQADFDAGRTAVARTNRELSRTPEQLKAIAAANARVNASFEPAKSTGTAGGKPVRNAGGADAKRAAEQYAAALKAYAEAEIEVAKKAAAAQREVAQAQLEEALNKRLVTQEQYLDKKAALEKQGVADERKTIRDRQAVLAAEMARETDPAKRKKLEADILKLQGDLDALASKEVVIDTKLRIDKQNFKREVESLRVDITANILDLEGNPFESTLQRLQKETQDLLNDPRVRGNAEMEGAVRRQAQLREERAQFDEQKRLSEQRLDFMRLAEDEIALKVEQGKMTALEAERAVREERLAGAAAILDQVKALEALAAANPANNDLALSAQRARLEYEKLNSTLDATATSINRDIADSFAGVLDALGRGENAVKSLGSALSNVFGNLAKRALKQFEDSLFNALEGKAGQGAGGLLSQFLGGKGFDLSKLWGGITSMFGFAEGGFTGSGGKYQPAGIVHRGEWVFTKAEVAKMGLPFFYSLRNNIRGGRRMPGYAEGGLVGGGLAGVAERSFNPTLQNNIQLAPNLYIDPSDLANVLGRQPQFGRDVAKVVFVDNESKLRR